MSERISLARTVTERKVHLALREKSPRKNKAFRQATVGCATNAQAFLPTVSARGNPSQKVEDELPVKQSIDNAL